MRNQTKLDNVVPQKAAESGVNFLLGLRTASFADRIYLRRLRAGHGASAE